MDRVELSAPAKVNLHLAVGALRPDGYHEVETVLQAVDLSDRIVVRRAPELAVECIPDLGLSPEENLAYKAASMLAERLGRKPAVAIELRKSIPWGAGLGGGSSDAAAVLVGCAVLWGVDPDDPLLVSVAASLGADVPFFLSGGVALYVGRGDEFVRHFPSAELPLAIVRPFEPVATGAAYSVFDRVGDVERPDVGVLEEALASGDGQAIAHGLFNNMTPASVALVPSVGEVIEFCRGSVGVRGSLMAGSGSAVFAVCETAEHALGVAEAAKRRGWWSVATAANASGVQIVSVS